MRVKELFAEVDFYDGKEVGLDDFVGSVFNEKSNFRKDETKSIYTGSIAKENIAKLRYQNGKNYINKQVKVFNGVDDIKVTVSPTILFDLFTAKNITNGVQYRENAEADVMNYNSRYMETFKYDEMTDLEGDDLKFGTDDNSDVPTIDILVFECTHQPNAINSGHASNLAMTHKMSNNKVKINPKTGILIEQSY